MATITSTEASSRVQHPMVQEQIGRSTPVTTRASRGPRLIQQTNGTWTSMPLEDLEKQHKPRDLTGKVSVKGGPPVDIGGFATIHVGDYDGAQVAVKAFKPGKSPVKDIQRLPKEIRVCAALDHPNILEFHGFITGFGDWPCLVTKWYNNGCAYRYLKCKQLEIVELWGLVCNVANGLAYLHALNITHGDLTPKNILIDDDGVARLCDFGLVTLVEWQGSLSFNSTVPVAGVPRYQAPELISPKDNIKSSASFATDVYSFACIASEFLTGKRPFSSCEYPEEVMEVLKRKEPPVQRPEWPLSPSEGKLWDLLERCWNLDAKKRPNIEDVICTLKGISPRDLPQPIKEMGSPQRYEHRPSLSVNRSEDGRIRQLQQEDKIQDSPIEQQPVPLPRKEDEYILVMGPTGSGKTTFINEVTGSKLLVGHTLVSCTEHVNFSSPLQLAGRSVILFDTPGLDDTLRSDADIFTEIAAFLAHFQEQQKKLIGVIYVHDIAEVRFTGATLRNLEVFRKAVGDVASKNVVIVTTKWDTVDEAAGDHRLAQLEQGFFKALLNAGATMHKLTPGGSGVEIVSSMLEHHARTSLQLQTQFGKDGMKLKNTDAGNILDKDYQQRINDINSKPTPKIGYYMGDRSNGASVMRKNSNDSKVRELQEKREKIDKTFEEVKRTPIGQRVSELLGKIFKSILPKRMKSRRKSSAASKSKRP